MHTASNAGASAGARKLAAACLQHDGVPPFSDQALVELARGERQIVTAPQALAVVSDEQHETELAVHPDARGRGIGTDLARRVIAAADGAVDFWAHGDLPASRAIAKRLGFTRVRELLQLRAALPGGQGGSTPDPEVRSFEASDAAALLALNAAAFADHPEQGSMSADDLAARLAEPWHNDGNLLLLERDGALNAFAWIKPAGDVAELYVLGVRPGLQGAGLGRRMLGAATARMRELGHRTAHLYVEGDNAAALALYRKTGFSDWAVDVRWRAGA